MRAKSKRHATVEFTYSRISELPAEEQQLLRQWMSGQTCPLVPGGTLGDAIYCWDYERWQAATAGKPVVWD